MEFHEKLQALRKKKGLTQEELAQALYVSRTAVSKWESGRGCPGIESLKAIAAFFLVSIDELLSGEELLTIAEEERKHTAIGFCDLVFALLDLSAAMLLFLPLFAQTADGRMQEVSLLAWSEGAPYVRTGYYAFVVGSMVAGILTLALQNCRHAVWVRNKGGLSVLLGMMGVLLCIISRQPYAAILLFAFLSIKVLLLLKGR